MFYGRIISYQIKNKIFYDHQGEIYRAYNKKLLDLKHYLSKQK